METNGEDIRFASIDGLTEFPVEIQQADTVTGLLIAWVKIPSISDGLEFFMYYDNPNASAFPTPKDVWPTGGQNLDGTRTLLTSAVSATGQLLILKNFIQGPTGTEELDPTKHELDNLNARGVRFYSHVIFMDTFFSVDSI